MFVGFIRFLIIYMHKCLTYNICSAWFLDIRISTCFRELLLAVHISALISNVW